MTQVTVFLGTWADLALLGVSALACRPSECVHSLLRPQPPPRLNVTQQTTLSLGTAVVAV